MSEDSCPYVMSMFVNPANCYEARERWFQEQIDRLKAELEMTKSLLRMSSTAVPELAIKRAEAAEKKLERVSFNYEQATGCIENLEIELSRYKQGVEVECKLLVDENEVQLVSDVRDWPVGHGCEIGQRVRVLVMKEEG